MYSLVDIEGNGGGYGQECIIEIALFRFDGHKITNQFISLVNPEEPITPYVQRLTGITPGMVKQAPKFYEIAKFIMEITHGTTLVGHNVEYDYRMLRQSFKRLGFEYQIPVLDTLPLAKKLIPEAESYSLGNLVKSLRIPHVKVHRAEDDARATLELFRFLMRKDKSSEIIQRQYAKSNAKSYPNKVKELTQDLPSEIGILYFQKENGQLLHTCYAENMNRVAKKVLSYESKKWTTLQKECAQINYEKVGSTLVAQLILHTKGMYKPERLPFGLYQVEDSYVLRRVNLQKNDLPILRFVSLSQARKVLNFIGSLPDWKNPSDLKQFLDIKSQTGIWSLAGRTLGEKVFLILQKGKVKAYGFYELYSQISSKRSVDQLKIPIQNPEPEIENDLRLSLLRGAVEIFPLPEG
ncbi:MAG: 3'-5' exonuclease [Bergeyella sp.]|nr:3'-5' exonuclease [Bergeyella sp.]